MVPFWKEALEMVLDVEPGGLSRHRGCVHGSSSKPDPPSRSLPRWPRRCAQSFPHSHSHWHSRSLPSESSSLRSADVSSLTPLLARRRLVQDPRRVHCGELCRAAVWPGAPAVHTHQSGLAIDGACDWSSSLATSSLIPFFQPPPYAHSPAS
jgi:hypothetical protein